MDTIKELVINNLNFFFKKEDFQTAREFLGAEKYFHLYNEGLITTDILDLSRFVGELNNIFYGTCLKSLKNNITDEDRVKICELLAKAAGILSEYFLKQ